MSAVLDTGGAAAAALEASLADSASGRVSPDQNDSVCALSIDGRTVTVEGQTYLMHNAERKSACIDGFTAISSFLKDSPTINGFIAGGVSEIKVFGEELYYRVSLKIGEQNFEANVVNRSSKNIVFISRVNPGNRVTFTVDKSLDSADKAQQLTLALLMAFKDAMFKLSSASDWQRSRDYQEFSVTPDVPTGTYALCYHPWETCFVLTAPTGEVEKLSVKEDGEQAYKFSNGLCFKTAPSFAKEGMHTEQITFDVGALAD